MSNDNSQIKVSILIPVYGVEKYIEKCARSLFEQTIKEGIEFIFVDDCTPDNSIAILRRVLEDYPHRKHQVRIVRHEENKGLAVARVTGVNAAQGEYVAHCDSDDWVEPDMYELMYDEAKRIDADIIGCDVFEENRKGTVAVQYNFKLPREKLIEEMLLATGAVKGYLWLRLIRRSFYDTKKYFAPYYITACEDLVVSIPMHLYAKTVGYVNKNLYHYNLTNSQSITSSFNLKNLNSAIKASFIINDSLLSNHYLLDKSQRRSSQLMDAFLTQREVFDPEYWREEYSEISKKFNTTFPRRILHLAVMLHMDLLIRRILEAVKWRKE